MSSGNKNHTGINLLPVLPHVKQAEAEQIAADIAAFKAAGGKIQKLKPGEGARVLKAHAMHINRANSKARKATDIDEEEIAE